MGTSTRRSPSAFWSRGGSDGRTAVAYIVTQVLAAIVAAAALKASTPRRDSGANLGTPHLAASIS